MVKIGVKTLKAKLVLAVALVVLVTVVVSSWLSAVILADNYQAEIKQKHFYISNALTGNVQAFLDKAFALSQQMAEMPSIPKLLQYASFRAITALSVQGTLAKECCDLSRKCNAVMKAL